MLSDWQGLPFDLSPRGHDPHSDQRGKLEVQRGSEVCELSREMRPEQGPSSALQSQRES